MDIVNSFFMKSELKARGWTDALINKFMPDPDMRKDHPKYPGAPQICLYRIIRVMNIERSQEFSEAFSKQRKRIRK